MLAHAGLVPETARIVRSADLRFRGQDFEIVVELPAGPYTRDSERAIADAFRTAYERAFSRVPPGVEVEVVNVRVAARAGGEGRGTGATGATGAEFRAVRGERDARKGTRLAYFPENRRPVRTPVFDRYLLRPGDRFPGPAIVEERESTAVVGPGGRFEIDDEGNLVMIRTDPAASERPAPSADSAKP